MRQGSEVARLMQQIEAEYEAGRQGLSGLAQGTTRHRLITARTERLAHCIKELRQVVGEEQARDLLIQWGTTQ